MKFDLTFHLKVKVIIYSFRFAYPLAINLLKKISLNHPVKIDAIQRAEQILSTKQLLYFNTKLINEIDHLMLSDDDIHSPHYQKLEQLQQKLKAQIKY